MKPIKYIANLLESHGGRPGLIRWLSFNLVAMISLALCGCSSQLKFTKRQIGPVGSYGHTQVADGLAIGIDPITNRTEVVSLFGTDLVNSRLLPVLIVASNQNSSLSYVVSPSQVRLINGKYESKSNEKAKGASMAGSEAAGWTVAVLGIGPTLLAAPFLSASVDKVMVINQHMHQEQLLQKTLSPGIGTHGYLYFNIPEDKQRVPEWTLVFKAKVLPGGEEKEITFPYNW